MVIVNQKLKYDGVALVILHVLAALKHQFISGDGFTNRMRPL